MTWTRTRLKYLAQQPITNGLGEAAQDGNADWPRYIRTTDIRSARALDDDKRVTMPPVIAAKADVQRDDLLLCAAGSLGKSYLHQSDEAACYAGYLVRFRPDTAKVDARFVAYWAESDPFLKQIAAGAVRSTIDNFSAGKYRQMVIDICSLPEQRRIADFLDDQVALLDRSVRLRVRQSSLMSERRAAAFAETILKISGIEMRGLDPASRDGWTPLSKVLTQLTNGFVGPTRDLLVPEGVPYLQSLHIKGGTIDFERRPYFVPPAWLATRPRIVLRQGDVLIVQTGALGEVALVDDTWAGASCHALLIARSDRRLLRPDYLWHLLRSDWGRNALRREETGALHPHLEAGKVRDIVIPLPSLVDQKRVVEALAERESEANHLTALLLRQQRLLSERRRALITAAVSGQFDVTAARSVA